MRTSRPYKSNQRFRLQKGLPASDRIPAWRVTLIRTAIVVAAVVLFARSFQIQVLDQAIYAGWANKQYQALKLVQGSRGIIYDRDGTALVLNKPCYDVGLVRALVDDKEATSQALAKILGRSSRSILKQLNKKNGFVLLGRRIEPERALVIKSMNLPGVTVDESSVRIQPFAEKLAPVLGMVDIDGNGITGLELQYDQVLTRTNGKSIMQRDALGNLVMRTAFAQEARSGYHIALTIDDVIQTIAEEELRNAIEEYDAEGGTVIVTVPETGEILAMASAPSFNPEQMHRQPVEARRIRPITDIYEPGSTFKVVTLAALLTHGDKTLDDIVYCENGAFKLYGEVIHDTKKFGWLSLENVFVRSSNIGASKIALDLGTDALYVTARNFGFGNATGIDLPGEVPGILKNPRHWSKISPAAISFGHEVAVTPLQITMAYAAIANGGHLMKPYIVKEIRNPELGPIERTSPQPIRQVLDAHTTRTVIRILERVVQEGTGTEAQIGDLRIAGKTGTAQKIRSDQPGYSKSSYLASFVGFYPADKAEILIHVTVDDPKPEYYGGKVAAPVFRNILNRILVFQNRPASPAKPEVLAESNAEVPEQAVSDEERNFLPALKGKRKEDAVKLVNESGLIPKIIGQGPLVERAELKGSANGKSRAVVVLTLGSYPESRNVTVPDLRNLSLRQAISELSKRSLNVKVFGSGTVKRQDPAPGKKLKIGATCLIECEQPQMSAFIDQRYGTNP